jgi:DNA topoisomerase-1
VTLDFALSLLDQAAQGEEPLGSDPETGKPVYLKTGRFGPYVQLSTPDDEEKPKNASLLKGMNPADVDLATALKLLSLPRNLGDHPQLGKPVMAYNGRFGPYVKCGDETRSLPADISPLEVTLDQAVHLLAQPKQRGRGRGAAKREPLKVFEVSPVTGEKVQLLDGRYGPPPGPAKENRRREKRPRKNLPRQKNRQPSVATPNPQPKQRPEEAKRRPLMLKSG